jgi:uncharacterized protein YsxB (DUF464 family)
MNSVVVRKDSQGRFCGFSSSGHTGYDERGYDIACAGISTLTITAIMALEQLTTLNPLILQDEAEAFIECHWTNEPSQVDKSDLIIQMMLLGLSEIKKQYPQHLSIQEVEV